MSAALQRLIDRAHAADIAIHALAVSVDGDVVVRTGVAPFGTDVPHRMYSVSKSITAIAILLLADEGRLSLDDPIALHFPEFGPVHPWLAATRIDDMLAMAGPHSRTTYVADRGGWLESYFRMPPTHRPGTLFTYDTSASYVLSALVERLSGATMLEYLRPRLLEPLEVGRGMRFLTGPEGISHGGSGLIAAPDEMLRIAEAVNGASDVLAPSIRDRLIERRSDPGTQTWGASLRHGYGRQIWLPADDSWLMFGLGGQLVYGEPSTGIAAVVTADTTTLASGDQRLIDLLLPELGTQPHGPLHLSAPSPPHDPAAARPLRGEYALIGGENAPRRLSVALDGAGGAIEVQGCTLRVDTECGRAAVLPLGDAVVTAGWSADGVLDVRISAAADDIASVRMRLVVTDDDILTVMSQGFGPEIGAEWTWQGSFEPSRAPVA
ncbi:Beta-lactamase [Microbacterium hydrocarbonoxydans]|uniref:Beta-lactamase n=1 Tax=Microbacterium hydrocarbonoxydans TaxID=273678 RepID=A0A0M2HRR8_9MICO|nr:serine hydrolase domain-containing protein [Microbacterium hydrocarbonoxydans]KJL47184.1 Beta-lactamase [Microbacterium hydrocarbonoxydans]